MKKFSDAAKDVVILVAFIIFMFVATQLSKLCDTVSEYLISVLQLFKCTPVEACIISCVSLILLVGAVLVLYIWFVLKVTDSKESIQS